MKTVFLRALEIDDKASALAAAREGRLPDGQRFVVDVTDFTAVVGSPFAYWMSEGVRGLFKHFGPFEADGRVARQGLATADDFRFVRAWWAVPPSSNGDSWRAFAKGGRFSPFYGDLPA
jgi:hypothetical protein